ncbi:hypothetical protein MLD38_024385 [Melastoma candidum]|uniref:Uncharacterized protein n=1 Tax=Melastoma candidum TaxID=119954 RepID=A0ACB9NYV7_9MYRT|nr:hypothetical protein MLD38_024385 [Melastoma candidum]
MEISSTDESTASDSISISPPYSTLPVASPSLSPPPPLADTGVEAESRKLPSSKYKGVVPQPNGRWGAQIYEKHQRVWLGTFNDEDEAARSYDVAARRFRGRDAVTNFKKLGDTGESVEDGMEVAFLESHSKAEIVDMLRKHTYRYELEQSRRSYRATGCDGDLSPSLVSGGAGGRGDAREQLFEKAVTPSDVGKLNRLVIPKQHAEKHFPLQGGATSSSKGILLNFEDDGGKVWRFRYSYWKSSQSYVLTKGWSRFVKEKNLKAGDTVCFQRSTGQEKKLYINFRPWSNAVPAQSLIRPVQIVRLFGVNILKIPNPGIMAKGGDGVAVGRRGGWCSGRKRMREVDLLSFECSKKQMVVGAL